MEQLADIAARWEAAFNARDAGALASLYSEPVVSGKVEMKDGE